jgi:hypothetical protein
MMFNFYTPDLLYKYMYNSELTIFILGHRNNVKRSFNVSLICTQTFESYHVYDKQNFQNQYFKIYA